MSSYRKGIGAAGLFLAFGLAAIAPASPIGTPAANRIPTGKGKAIGNLFDDMVRPGHGKANADDPTGKTSKSGRKRLTNAEWHKAYIARHGHDLLPLTHPGH